MDGGQAEPKKIQILDPNHLTGQHLLENGQLLLFPHLSPVAHIPVKKQSLQLMHNLNNYVF